MPYRKFRQLGVFPGALLVAALGMTGAGHAADATGVLNVTATISSDCTVGASTLAFGTISSAVVQAGNVDATGTVTVNCTNGVAYTVKLNVGSGPGARFTSRVMTSGVNQLNYSIYNSTAHTDVWGDGSGSTATIAGTGTGTAQSLSAYGRIFSGQTPQPGAYTDTVNVTVSY